MREKSVTIYTDGSCFPNPGKMGYAALLVYEGNKKLVTGNSGNETGTNNQAEIMAAIIGLDALRQSCEVLIITDSQYLANIGNGVWQPKSNFEILQKLEAAEHTHEITFRWVREFTLPEQTIVHNAADKESKS